MKQHLKRTGAVAFGLLFYFATSGTIGAFGTLRGTTAIVGIVAFLLAALWAL